MKLSIYILTVCLLISSACDSDFPNPNAPTTDDVLSSPEGLIGLVVGGQHRYTSTALSGLYAGISAAGLSTFELQVLNAGNTQIAALANGGDNVAPNNTVVTNLWTNLNLLRSIGEDLIANRDVIPDEDLANTIQVFGHLYKAYAIGTMAQFWPEVVLETGVNAEFVSREDGLQEAITLLDQADALFQSVSGPQLGDNIDLGNVLNALSARYNLMLGNNAQALARAEAVDLTSVSEFLFDEITPNPIFRSSLVTNNVYDVNPDFGLTGALVPDPADERIDFYLTANAENGKGFFLSDSEAIPLYLPGEMTLIKAEVHARENRLTEAVEELDNVLTKTAGDDPLGVGANLPAYSGPNTQDAILLEIYRNRAIELYMTGLKLEDSRRFDRPGPNDPDAERNRNYYPYPVTERDSNPNTPDNPPV